MVNSKLDISINFYLPKMHSQVVCEPEKTWNIPKNVKQSFTTLNFSYKIFNDNLI